MFLQLFVVDIYTILCKHDNLQKMNYASQKN